ncbi:hypothetical protein SAMN02745975_01122 [Geosporobacter subterraneus DSM 17957]|uniref:Uncharacterized protein n=1 Tax=Geosporobacter subterraneus DSM 17957 TaxID=1121919 RepID=A0A1M6FX40_9FIRM|nr:hypothetical protein SAMN02745975_01122 [Geosporobacter subterraneus DSM 17957]
MEGEKEVEFHEMNDQAVSSTIIEACKHNDKRLKHKLIEASNRDPRIAAKVLESLYELVDYDLNFVIDILTHCSKREHMHVLKEAKDPVNIIKLFDEYSRERLEALELEDIVEGRDLDIIWEVKEGPQIDALSRAYLQRCLLAIAYHLGYHEELKTFFEEEKRKYLVLH